MVKQNEESDDDRVFRVRVHCWDTIHWIFGAGAPYYEFVWRDPLRRRDVWCRCGPNVCKAALLREANKNNPEKM